MWRVAALAQRTAFPASRALVSCVAFPCAAASACRPASFSRHQADCVPRRFASKDTKQAAAAAAAAAVLEAHDEAEEEKERQTFDSDGKRIKDQMKPFALSKKFLSKYTTAKPPFGFGVMGELVYRRTYSRLKEDGTKEQWWETVERVVNGTYNMQRDWIQQHDLGWNAAKARKSAQEMYERIFHLKFLPPGRGLWAMGSRITQIGLNAALNNCAFVSTEPRRSELQGSECPAQPFCFLMDLAMLGVGVGFDTTGAGKIHVKQPLEPAASHTISDDREGWVHSVRLLLLSYFMGRSRVEFNYSRIRPAGSVIKGFGGLASGPEPLKRLHLDIRNTLDALAGQTLTVTGIVDLMNLIGRCVVSGNQRQTAEISFGDPRSVEYINLKDYTINPQRAEYGWTSNNSVFAELGMDYSDVCDRILKNGEPGFAWLSNMRSFGRLADPRNEKDRLACGGNPCLEQTLESYELCCLVETFPNNHESLEDFQRTLKFAFLYAKTVTLGKTHWPESNRVMLRNRRIGCSMSGIAQFITKHGIDSLKTWADKGYSKIQEYDALYSDWFAIPRSIKTTCIKPSGTVSLLAGATPGMHYPLSRYYIRRVRLPANSQLLAPMQNAGYHTEACIDDPRSMVVEIPIDVGTSVRKAADISMWEQLSLAAFLQRHWADNQVSCTVSFNPDTEGSQIRHALQLFQYQLKGVSFLPLLPPNTSYKQLPYEEIDEARYKQIMAGVAEKVLFVDSVEAQPDKFCDSAVCEVNGRPVGVGSGTDSASISSNSKSTNDTSSSSNDTDSGSNSSGINGSSDSSSSSNINSSSDSTNINSGSDTSISFSNSS